MEHPGIFFFPFSEPEPVDVTGLEPGVLSRRIPDFLCICLNDNGRENAGLLEIRAADEDGVPTGNWLALDQAPEADDVMSFLPNNGVTAAIVGTLKLTQDQVRLDAPTHRDDGLEIDLTLIRDRHGLDQTTFPWRLNLKDPGTSCVALARRIARELAVPMNSRTWEKVGTHNPTAFLHFLRGLDGAASLDPEVLLGRDPRELLEPFIEALIADPEFGLALRRLHVAIHEAVHACVMTLEEGVALLDRALSAYPADHEAAASIGEFLVAVEENDRAEEWLRLAVSQPEPPASALETLGILLANRDETVQARNLWLTGVRLDGHPDFFAHLARLAFTENDVDEAWDKVLRGLRRIYEQRLHPGEWEEEEGRSGVLLRYLSEHLGEAEAAPPPDVVDLLVDLCGHVLEPADRLELGLCLALVDRSDAATQALRGALPHVEDVDRRDVGAQRLAELLVPDFDERFKLAASIEEAGPDIDNALAFLREVSQEVPQLWPAAYFSGKLHDLRGELVEAANWFRKAASLRRDQQTIWARLAACASRAGDIGDACDAMERAVEIEPNDARLQADLALFLHAAGREEEARAAIEAAETLDPEDENVERARRVIAGD